MASTSNTRGVSRSFRNVSYRNVRLTVTPSDDRPLLRIPKSFAQLQALNGLLKKYRDIYPYRIVVCYVITYLLYATAP
jgi:hypothetical protein